jgi:hypothetical protein
MHGLSPRVQVLARLTKSSQGSEQAGLEREPQNKWSVAKSNGARALACCCPTSARAGAKDLLELAAATAGRKLPRKSPPARAVALQGVVEREAAAQQPAWRCTGLHSAAGGHWHAVGPSVWCWAAGRSLPWQLTCAAVARGSSFAQRWPEAAACRGLGLQPAARLEGGSPVLARPFIWWGPAGHGNTRQSAAAHNLVTARCNLSCCQLHF